MIYVHVKNLEKYQPGYTDRKHIWAKIYFDTFLDPAVQKLNEIDRYRFWSLIVFEVYLEGKPLALTNQNLKLMGWEAKKRHISLTLQMLHTLVDVRNDESESSVPQIRVEKIRVEKKREEKYTPEFENFWKKFKGRWNPDKGGSGGYIKVGKFAAFDEWQKLSKPEQEKATAAADKVTGKYTPDAERWLKRRLFDDFR